MAKSGHRSASIQTMLMMTCPKRCRFWMRGASMEPKTDDEDEAGVTHGCLHGSDNAHKRSPKPAYAFDNAFPEAP
jgi:hypothetical protein